MKRKPNRFTIEFSIPAYWTPEQALAVFELVNDLRDVIWSHYGKAYPVNSGSPISCVLAEFNT